MGSLLDNHLLPSTTSFPELLTGNEEPWQTEIIPTEDEGHHVVGDLSHANNDKQHCEHLPVDRENLQEAEASLHSHSCKENILPAKPVGESRHTLRMASAIGQSTAASTRE